MTWSAAQGVDLTISLTTQNQTISSDTSLADGVVRAAGLHRLPSCGSCRVKLRFGLDPEPIQQMVGLTGGEPVSRPQCISEPSLRLESRPRRFENSPSPSSPTVRPFGGSFVNTSQQPEDSCWSSTGCSSPVVFIASVPKCGSPTRSRPSCQANRLLPFSPVPRRSEMVLRRTGRLSNSKP